MATHLSLSFRISAQAAQALATLDRLKARIAQAGGQRLPDPTAAVTAGAERATASLGSLIARLAAVATAAVGVGAAVRKGFDVNSAVEDAQLGVKGLIAALGQVRDASGNLVEGPEALTVAAGIAREEVEKLRIAGLNTTATFQELLVSYQAALSSGLGAGFDPAQVRELTVGLVQAAGAMGIAMDQMKSEINALFTGDINQDSDLAKRLGITREQVQEWRASGAEVFYDKLNEKLRIFRLLGDEAGNTWSGTLANAAEAADVFFGKMSESAFSRIKTALQDALGGAFDRQTAEISDSFQGILAAGTAVFDGIGKAISDAIGGAVALAQELSEWFSTHEGQTLGIGNALGAAWDNAKGVLGALVGAVATTVKWLAETGLIQSAFETIARLVAMVQDGFRLMGMYAAQVGAVIVDKWGGAIRDLPGIFGARIS